MVLLVLMHISVHSRLPSSGLVLPKTLHSACQPSSRMLVITLILRDTLEGTTVARSVSGLVLEVFLVPSWGVGSENV